MLKYNRYIFYLRCLILFVVFGLFFYATIKVYAQSQKAVQDISVTTESSPVGYWQSVDFVKNVEDFMPGQKKWGADLYIKKVRCYENGETSISFTWGNGCFMSMYKDSTYTDQYYIKTMNDSTYLFLPWLVTLMTGEREKPPYYVLKMIADQPIKGCMPIRSLENEKIERHPYPMTFNRGKLDSIPTFNPASEASFQVDLRAYDLSDIDLSGSLENLRYADFDDETIWPPENRMPKDFDRQHIMESGKDPGLGIRSLHAKGITGRKVGIAIIDHTLLVDHLEYASQLRLYEETDDITGGAEMHGSAVASIAVGKTVGVAPEADLYYIATARGGGNGKDFSYLARCIRRILEVNRLLPDDRKIRVISMQIGWGPEVIGYDELTSAVEEAKTAGMLIICSSVERIHGFKFHGLGRKPMSDPNTFESYEPGLWWADRYYGGKQFHDRLLVPMDSRTLASPCGLNDYVFYREGGWSWSIPYIAGVYALAVQVDPTITPEKFWDLAMKTGTSIKLKNNGRTSTFGPILNPAALIDKLK